MAEDFLNCLDWQPHLGQFLRSRRPELTEDEAFHPGHVTRLLNKPSVIFQFPSTMRWGKYQGI